MPPSPRNKAEGDFGLAHERKRFGQRDWALISGVSLLLWVVVAGGMTQWAAGKLQFQPALGLPAGYWAQRPLYWPWASWVWLSKLPDTETAMAVARQIRLGHTFAGLVATMAGLALLMRRHQHLANRVPDIHGSARWARWDEVKKAGLLNGFGVVLGQLPHPRTGELRYLRHDGPEHVLTFAPTRSGKGVGQVLPTLLSWPHSAVVLDIKGENHHLTSGYRASIGQSIRRVNLGGDPFECSGFNSLAEIRIGTPHEIADVMLAANTLVNDTGKAAEGNQRHWMLTGRGLLGGAILHVLYRERAAGRVATGIQVRKELAGAVLADEMAEEWLSYPHSAQDEWVGEHGLGLLRKAAERLQKCSREECVAAFSLARVRFCRWADEENEGGSTQKEEESSEPVHVVSAFCDDLGTSLVGSVVRNFLLDCEFEEDEGLTFTEEPAAAALVGSLLHTVFARMGDGETPKNVHILATLRGERSIRDVLNGWKKYPHDTHQPWASKAGSDFIHTVASLQLNRDSREGASVLSSATATLDVYDDPNVQANTARHDFNIDQLVAPDRPVTVYLVLPMRDVARLAPLVRLFLEQVMTRLTESLPKEVEAENAVVPAWLETARKCAARLGLSATQARRLGIEMPEKRYDRGRLLLLLDEFPAIGRLPAVERALPFCAGYGIKAHLITQDVQQLQDVYGRNETILANCHIRCGYAPNHHGTAELLSRMLGKVTVVKQAKSRSLKAGSVLSAGANESDQEVGRPLLTPDECFALSPGETVTRADGCAVVRDPGQMIAFVAGWRPILAAKAQHYDDPVLRARAGVGPVVHRKG